MNNGIVRNKHNIHGYLSFTAAIKVFYSCLEGPSTILLNPNPDIEKIGVTNHRDLERFF
jgi:hypothetical protein